MGLVFCLVADENRQKQGKEVEKRHLYFFNIISTFTSQNKLRDSTSERKKNFLFTSACFNEHHSAVAEKNAVPFPASVPFNPIFVFFSSFSCFTFY